MNWKNIREAVWFIGIWLLAITLIEYSGDDWWLNIAGDIFGALGLMFLGAERALANRT